MRIFGIFLAIFISFSPVFSNTENNIELLNSTLITKLHFNTNPRDGQMVGAYQVSFRNETGAALNSVTMLLNPGLQFLKATGGKGETLRANSNLQTVPALAPLQLNTIRINLASPLDNTDRTEITIHYKGFLEDLSGFGLTGVKETLHPNFTMIRAQSFAYPVMATPTLADIERAWAHKPFRQVAFVEYPGLNEIIGSLDVAGKTLNGNRTDVELKSSRPTPLLSLAIAPFKITSNDAAKTAYLNEMQASAAQAISLNIQSEKARITALLGAPANDEMIKVIAVPDDYLPTHAGAAFFTNSNFFTSSSADEIPPFIEQSLLSLWTPTGNGRTGHWSNGLHAVITAALTTNTDMTEFQETQFVQARQLFEANRDTGKTPLTEYIIDGFTREVDAVSTLAYAALYDIMGRDDFFALVRGLYASTLGGYTDTEVVADYMQENIRSKDARKFVKNWFTGKRSGRDMEKSSTFTELTARYK